MERDPQGSIAWQLVSDEVSAGQRRLQAFPTHYRHRAGVGIAGAIISSATHAPKARRSTNWRLAALAMLPSAGHRVISRRLLAIELLTALSFILLIPLGFAFDQPSSIDLALTVSFLALPGTLLFACLGERWL